MKDTLPAIAERVARLVVKQQVFHPMVQLEYSDGYCIISFPRDKFGDCKDAAIYFVRALASLLNATAATFMAEVWMRTGENLDLEVPPSEAEDRKEGIFLIRNEHEKTSVMFFEIQRDDKGRIIGVQEIPSEKDKEIKGRFAKWLPDEETAITIRRVVPSIQDVLNSFRRHFGWVPYVVFPQQAINETIH